MDLEFNPVPSEQWRPDADTPEPIRSEIVEGLQPGVLADSIASLAVDAFDAQRSERAVAVYEEELKDRSSRDFCRDCVLVAIGSNALFNQFFNGRCGYRAMYWHSPTVGEAFNIRAVQAIINKLKSHAKAQRSTTLIKALGSPSLNHNNAKVWPFFEEKFLDKGRLIVPNWCSNSKGYRIFDPGCPVFVVKGAFLNEEGAERPTKIGRSEQLHSWGTT